MKKKKKMSVLYYYKVVTKLGYLPNQNGLCHEDGFKIRIELKPSDEEIKKLAEEDLSGSFWGSGLHRSDPERVRKVTPLRENLILLTACLNGEL